MSAVDVVIPVTLEELNDTAALQTRVDRKYVLTAERAERLLRPVTQRLAALEIDGSRRFRYDSLYFDTADLASYRAAATRRRRRFKVRIRHYVDSGHAALEVKTRGGRGETIKVRADHRPAPDGVLTLQAQQFIDDAIGAGPVATRLRPTLWTSYHRSTLVDLGDRSRVTIDHGLHARECAGEWRLVTDRVVIETKSVAGTTPLDRALWADHVRPVAISKYAIGMAVHHPDLPANRWSRLLRDHVTPRAGR